MFQKKPMEMRHILQTFKYYSRRISIGSAAKRKYILMYIHIGKFSINH